MKAAGLTQAELERRAKLNQSHLGVAKARWLASKEHEIREPRALMSIAEALGVTYDWLATGAGEEGQDPYPTRPPVIQMARELGVEEVVLKGIQAIRCGRGDPGEDFWWQQVRAHDTQVRLTREHLAQKAKEKDDGTAASGSRASCRPKA
jgi:transcriptional regulator with XRE-family HTH domain